MHAIKFRSGEKLAFTKYESSMVIGTVLKNEAIQLA